MKVNAKRKPVAQRQPRGRKRKRKRKPVAPATVALARIDDRPRVDEFTPEQVSLLQRTLAKGATPDEFALYLWVAKKHHLDPFTRQLHCVKRWDTKLNADVMTIQIGIDGYRFMAARSHADFGGVDEPEFEYEADNKTLKLARVRVWKKGFEHPTIGIAFWSEYCPDLNKPASFMWKKMPHGQLAKCAEALALRKAYPDLADVYTTDEMAQADDNRTPGGRVIVETSQPQLPQAIPEKTYAIELVPYKEGVYAITGVDLSLVRAGMTDEERGRFTIKYDKDAKGFTIPVSEAFSFQDVCKKYKVNATFAEKV